MNAKQKPATTIRPLMHHEAKDRLGLRQRLLKLIDEIANKEIDITEAAEINNAAGKYWKGVQLELMAHGMAMSSARLRSSPDGHLTQEDAKPQGEG